MFTILNRFPRGMYSIGAKFNGVVLGLLTYFVLHNINVAIAVAFCYVLGEGIGGWGDHEGNVSGERLSSFSYFPNDGDTVGIRWFTSMIVYPKLWKLHLRNAKIGIKNIYPRTMNLEIKGYSLAKLFKKTYTVKPIEPFYIDKAMTYSRVFLTIRGFYWWLPVMIPLYFVGIGIGTLAVALIVLSFGFLIASELGYLVSQKFSFKFLELSSGWTWQEVLYGLIQDITFISLYIYYKGELCGTLL